MLRRLPLVLAAFAVLAAALTTPAHAAETSVTVRGGDQLYSGGIRCRVGFNAHQGTTYYGLMPGHCVASGSTWYYRDPAGSVPVGTSASSSFPGNDYGLLRYYPTVSAPSEVAAGTSVFPITSARNPAVGERICMPSLSGGLRCGQVTAVNVTVRYADSTVYGLFSANLCAEPGDMGGPGFNGTAALGIAVGGQGSCSTGGVTYFQPVVEILSAYGLTIG
ncbi:S1 family peptidase [Streptomyces sp. DH24]|uniref:S1 family peptidase n=1 Tax=Streptomyces sp. DH24 TaxID=3040123 RepID=UPI002441C057|nr:S1 family peptidase [Streptomyces sp. DH24]MDG9719622.1 S1 family peptidase [Streptomyces sp. DH24]